MERAGEVERLMWEKERLEEERRAEQWHTAALCGSERAVKQRQAVLAASLPEAGPSRAPPQKPKRTTKGVDWGPEIIIPEKNCTWCVTWELL